MQKFFSALFALAILSGCSQKETEIKATSKVPVMTETPKLEDATLFLKTTGTLSAADTFNLKSDVAGIVKNVFVKRGEKVALGSPLIELENEQVMLQKREKELSLHLEEIGLKQLRQKLERLKVLADEELIAKVELEELFADIDKTETRINLIKTQIESLNLNLKNCYIAAPISGFVGEVEVREGESIEKNSPMTTISDLEKLKIKFYLNPDEASKISAADESIEITTLCAPATSPCASTATLKFKDKFVDSQNGLILLKAEMKNCGNNFQPGQIVKLQIPVEIMTQSLTIAQAAIKFNESGPYVYVLTPENSVEHRSVKVKNYNSERSIVLEGLSSQDKVIISGHQKIYPGAFVKEVEL